MNLQGKELQGDYFMISYYFFDDIEEAKKQSRYDMQKYLDLNPGNHTNLIDPETKERYNIPNTYDAYKSQLSGYWETPWRRNNDGKYVYKDCPHTDRVRPKQSRLDSWEEKENNNLGLNYAKTRN